MGLGSRSWTTAGFLSSLDGPIVRFPDRLGGPHCAAFALHCSLEQGRSDDLIDTVSTLITYLVFAGVVPRLSIAATRPASRHSSRSGQCLFDPCL